MNASSPRRSTLRRRLLAGAASSFLLGVALESGAGASPGACSAAGGRPAAGCVETCELGAVPGVLPSDFFLAKLRALGPTGHQVGARPGATPASTPGPTVVSQFRVASIPFAKEAAARWRQNGLWAGPCAGLTAAFAATVVDGKDPKKVVDLHELRYPSESAARRVAALLGSSWHWNGHPFIAVQRGPSVIVAEGRYGAWSTLEIVGAHFGGTVYPSGGSVSLPMCDEGSRARPIFESDGLAVHVLGFAPSGELAWLEETPGPDGGAAWTLRVSNLVNDRELAARTYRTVRPRAEAFCAEHRAAAGTLLNQRGVTGGEFTAFDQPTIDGAPVSVLIRPAASSGSELVMTGAPGTKVLGRLPGRAAKALGIVLSPFEERVAVLVAIDDAATGRPGLRVLGGRLDKRWLPRR